MSTSRRICVVTTTRAEYGLLAGLLRELRGDSGTELQLIVTGSHLSPAHGRTVTAIETDGFEIAARIPMLLDDDSPAAATKSLGLATIGFADALARLCPDLLVVLGDRYELLAAAQAALIARIPLAHIHGGELTEGAIDDAVRHAITKMAHLHFVASEAFRTRVIQLGEAPERVWTVGAPGLDNIAQLVPLGRPALERQLGMQWREPCFLVTYHPSTLAGEDPGQTMRTLLEVLDAWQGSIIVTGVNADPGNHPVRQAAQNFSSTRAGRVLLVESLGAERYLSVMHEADLVVGNSSSGLLEAPAMGKASVDIGSRQRGRPRAASVVHCEPNHKAITEAVTRALDKQHQTVAARRETPYGSPGAAARIAAVLRSHPLDGLVVKRFRDLPLQQG